MKYLKESNDNKESQKNQSKLDKLPAESAIDDLQIDLVVQITRMIHYMPTVLAEFSPCRELLLNADQNQQNGELSNQIKIDNRLKFKMSEV